MLYKGSNITSKLCEKMGSTAPVKVGTRGTVGSLVMKEIEYFRRCEVEICGSSIKPQKHSVDVGSSSGSSSWPNFGFLTMTWRKKKKRGSALVPRICSVVEVSKSHRHNGVPGFNYRNLKADVKNFQVGTRGTVGSLVMKEIEYFRRCEVEICGSSIKPQKHSVDVGSSSGSSSWPNFGFLTMTWRKKKKRGSALLPRICSVVEVSKSHQHNGVPGFNYRNLKADVKNFQV